MSVETAVRTAIPSDAVYAKTATGRGELAARGMGLSRRQRSVLIMLDGQRPCGALAAMMPDGQIADIVAELLALDLIAPCKGAAEVPVSAALVPAATVAVPASAAAADTPVSREMAPAIVPRAAVPAPAAATVPADVPQAGASYGDAGVAAIKAYMVQAAQTYLGLLAAEVVERIERAGDAAQLRGVVGHWHMALQASKHGRETAAVHIEYVRTGLRDAGIAA